MLPRDDRRRSHDVTSTTVWITCHYRIVPGFGLGAFVAYRLVLEAANVTKLIRALSRSRTIFDFCTYLLIDLQEISLGRMMTL